MDGIRISTNMIHPYYVILFSLKKVYEALMHATYGDKTSKIARRRKKPDPECHGLLILFIENVRNRQTHRQSRSVIAEAGGEAGNGIGCFLGA